MVNEALNQAYTYSRLAAPAVSEYCSAKLWLAPDPELGVTETVAGTPAATGTVQAPSCCHPLLEPDTSVAYR